MATAPPCRSRDGTMVGALASYQCSQGSISWFSFKRGLSLLLVLVLALRRFRLGSSAPPPPPPTPKKNSTFLNSNYLMRKVSPISTLHKICNNSFHSLHCFLCAQQLLLTFHENFDPDHLHWIVINSSVFSSVPIKHKLPVSKATDLLPFFQSTQVSLLKCSTSENNTNFLIPGQLGFINFSAFASPSNIDINIFTAGTVTHTSITVNLHSTWPVFLKFEQSFEHHQQEKFP